MARGHTSNEGDEENENPVQQAAKRPKSWQRDVEVDRLFEHRRMRCCERRWPRALDEQKPKP